MHSWGRLSQIRDRVGRAVYETQRYTPILKVSRHVSDDDMVVTHSLRDPHAGTEVRITIELVRSSK